MDSETIDSTPGVHESARGVFRGPLPAIAHIAAADVQTHRLRLELAPQTELEKVAVDRIVANVGKLEEAQQAWQTLIAAGSQMMADAMGGTAGGSADVEKALQLASKPLARVGQHAATAERNLRGAIYMLRDLRRDLRLGHSHEPFDETQCIAWLAQRFATPGWACAKCGGVSGIALSRRAVWECRTCKHQVGVRAGTVMERSQVPLGVWFLAIKIIIEAPAMSGRKLAQLLDVRPQTAHSMRRRINDALDHPEQRHRLAGVDRLFGDDLSQAPRPPVLMNTITPPVTATEAVFPLEPVPPPEPGVPHQETPHG